MSDRRSDLMDSLAELVGTGLQAGRGLFDVVVGSASAMSGPVASLRAAVMPASAHGCQVPDPCWMPRRLPDVSSTASPGATATLRLLVTNGGPDTRTVTVSVQGDGGAVQVDPPTLTLEPFEEGVVVATVRVPEEGATPVDARVWVRGCHDHVVRWRVGVSDRGCSTTHELAIHDSPDLVHHWYDHFYCERPCPAERAVRHG